MKRTLLVLVLLAGHASVASAQHRAQEVNLPDVIRLTDSILSPAPIQLTWDPLMEGWAGNLMVGTIDVIYSLESHGDYGGYVPCMRFTWNGFDYKYIPAHQWKFNAPGRSPITWRGPIPFSAPILGLYGWVPWGPLPQPLVTVQP